MPSVTYNLNIPATNNNPSDDQPLMLQNTNAVQTLLQVDHIGFNDGNDNSGYHQWVTFNDKNTPVADQFAGNRGVMYQIAGIANTDPDVFFQNATGLFPVTKIKAMALFTTQRTTDGASAYAPTAEININGDINEVRGAGVSTITVHLDAGITTGNNIFISITASNIQGNALGWTYTNPDLNIITAALDALTTYSVIVYQI